jgi:hypothetical protein
MANFSGVEGRTGQPEIDPELHDVAQVVHEEFDQHLDPSAVDECLQKVVSRFEGATIRSFIPLLVGRYVREELRTLLRQSPNLQEMQ